LFGDCRSQTGKIDGVKAEIDRNKYFGEGMAFLNAKVINLLTRAK
jgi:hypothetical protein